MKNYAPRMTIRVYSFHQTWLMDMDMEWPPCYPMWHCMFIRTHTHSHTYIYIFSCLLFFVMKVTPGGCVPGPPLSFSMMQKRSFQQIWLMDILFYLIIISRCPRMPIQGFFVRKVTPRGLRPLTPFFLYVAKRIIPANLIDEYIILSHHNKVPAYAHTRANIVYKGRDILENIIYHISYAFQISYQCDRCIYIYISR